MISTRGYDKTNAHDEKTISFIHGRFHISIYLCEDMKFECDCKDDSVYPLNQIARSSCFGLMSDNLIL